MTKPTLDVLKRNEAILVSMIRSRGRLPVTTTNVQRFLQLLNDYSYANVRVGYNYRGNNWFIISSWRAFRRAYPSPANNNIGAFIRHFAFSSGKSANLLAAVDNVIARSKWSGLNYNNILTNYRAIARETRVWRSLPLSASKLNGLGWRLGPAYRPNDTRTFFAWTGIQLNKSRSHSQWLMMKETRGFTHGDTRFINNWLVWTNSGNGSAADLRRLLADTRYMSAQQRIVYRGLATRTVNSFINKLAQDARTNRDGQYRSLQSTFNRIFGLTDKYGTPVPIGDSHDILTAAYNFADQMGTRVNDLNREWAKGNGLLLRLGMTLDGREQTQIAANVGFADEAQKLRDRYIAFLNVGSDTYEKFMTQYQYKAEMEERERQQALLLTVFGALASVGSIGFLVSNVAATIRQALSATAALQFLTGNLGASFGSVTLSMNNPLLTQTAQLRTQRVDNAYRSLRNYMVRASMDVRGIDAGYIAVNNAIVRYLELADRFTGFLLERGSTNGQTLLERQDVFVLNGQDPIRQIGLAGIVTGRIGPEKSGFGVTYWREIGVTEHYYSGGKTHHFALYGISSDRTTTIDGLNSSATLASASLDVVGQDPEAPGDELAPAAYSDRLAALVLEEGTSPASFTSLSSSKAKFDVWGGGERQSLAWAGPRTGLLAFDKEGDGIVGDFDEVDFTKTNSSAQTVLEALRAYDTNRNNALDAGDVDWGRFGLWVDANGDGVGQRGEFRSLAQHNIRTISLLSDVRSMASNTSDVQIHGSSQVRRANGSTTAAREVSFRVDWDSA